MTSLVRIAFHLSIADQILDSVKNSCPTELPNVGNMLGKGMQGEVYDLGDRVLKIQVVFDEEAAEDKIGELEKLMQRDSEVYPKIYDVEKLCDVENPKSNMPEGYAYYYVMEKLKPAKDAKEIAEILRAKIDNKPIMDYMGSRYFDDAMDLYGRMEDSGTVHIDVNDGAIMRAPSGELKLVDLDSVVTTS